MLTSQSAMPSGNATMIAGGNSTVSAATSSACGTKANTACRAKWPPSRFRVACVIAERAERRPEARRVGCIAADNDSTGATPSLATLVTTSYTCCSYGLSAASATGTCPRTRHATWPGDAAKISIQRRAARSRSVAATASPVGSPECTSRLTTAGGSAPRSIVAGAAVGSRRWWCRRGAATRTRPTTTPPRRRAGRRPR